MLPARREMRVCGVFVPFLGHSRPPQPRQPHAIEQREDWPLWRATTRAEQVVACRWLLFCSVEPQANDVAVCMSVCCGGAGRRHDPRMTRRREDADGQRREISEKSDNRELLCPCDLALCYISPSKRRGATFDGTSPSDLL